MRAFYRVKFLQFQRGKLNLFALLTKQSIREVPIGLGDKVQVIVLHLHVKELLLVEVGLVLFRWGEVLGL